jgi:Tfp pilus assembly protein PilO
MVLSGRERYIFIGVVIALAALVLDRLVLSPFLIGLSAMETQRASLSSQLSRDNALVESRGKLQSQWSEMVKAGMKSDPAGAEIQVLQSIRDWARESGISLSLLKPDRLAGKSRLPEISFQASGTGNMNAVSQLLWRVQTAKIPIKLTELQIGARKEGVDDLSFQMRVSTVYAPPRPSPASAPSSRPETSGGS